MFAAETRLHLAPRLVGAALCLCATLLLCGCGGADSGKALVKGRIVMNGEPLVVQGQEIGVGRVEVRLVNAQGFAEEVALANVDGEFEFHGDGGGVPAGTYKISVKQIEPQLPKPPEAGRPAVPAGDLDLLNGAFDEKNTPIQREIGEGDVDLGTIDLAEEKK
jgi:hypothetical protein